MSVKTKIRLGLLFLLAIIFLLAGAGSYYINRLADESKDILKDNYNTLQYTKNMIEALDRPEGPEAIRIFEENLVLQENNITEQGEQEATKNMRNLFEAYKAGNGGETAKTDLRKRILSVQELNMKAIVQKNDLITQKTKTAFAYISLLGTICFLLSFTFVINFPRWIADPIARLTEGIKRIAAKDYNTRIEVSSKDEFGEVATAFNSMAAELNAWEHSNVSKLMFEKSRIETIINNMQDPVIGLDAERKILFVNTMAENILMLKKAEMVGKYAPDLAVKNDLLRNLLNKDREGDLKIYANNKESYFTRNYREVHNDGEVIGEVIVLHNVTPFKELDFAKTNFLATVSHELKTPIAATKMSLRLLKDPKNGTLNADQQQLLDSIAEDIDRLLKIIGELLNMTQLETGNILLNINQVSVKQIIDLALSAVRTAAEEKHITIKTTIAENTPSVNADLDKTVWVMVNLLTNAIRYSHPNSEIAINVQQQNSSVSIAVHDSGIGIDARYLPRIFDRYYKVPGSQGGTGLGLAISKEFIEAQGGKIAVESEPAKGTTFKIALNTV